MLLSSANPMTLALDFDSEFSWKWPTGIDEHDADPVIDPDERRRILANAEVCKQAIQDLQKRLQSEVSALHKALFQVAPVRRAPPEILSEIFTYLAGNTEDFKEICQGSFR
jgi:hypothetical protein